MQKADVFSAPTESSGWRIDRAAAECISGQTPRERVIVCSPSLHSRTTLLCQFVIRAQQSDAAPPDLRGHGAARRAVRTRLGSAETSESYSHGNNNSPGIQ